MNYNNLSKDELLLKIEKLEKDLHNTGNGNRELERSEETAKQQSLILKFINSLAIPSADKSTIDEISQILLKAVKTFTGAVVAVFNFYDSDKKELVLFHIEAEQDILKKALKIASKKLINTKIPVDNKSYNLIINDIVGRYNSFTEVTFGAIPKLIDKGIRASTGINELFPIAHVIEGELFGTSLLAFKKGHPLPSIELLESYAHLMSVSLRRYKTEESLKKSEEKYRNLYNSNPLMIFTIDEDGNILSVNESGIKHLGYSKNDLLGNSVLLLFHDDDKQKVVELKEECLLNPDKIMSWELRKITKKGKLIYVKENARVIQANDGSKIVLVMCEDITEQKRTEKALIQAKELAEKNEEKFKLLNRLTNEMLLLPDVENIYNFITQTLQNHYPNTLVLTNSIDESKEQTKLEIISGLNSNLLKKVINISGFNPIGKTYKLTELHKNYFKSGNFIEFTGGLQEFSSSAVSAVSAKALEKLIGIHKIYTIGINKDDELLSAIHFFTYNKQVVTDANFIEIFVKEAGLVLQKKINEKVLKTAKEKAEESEKQLKHIADNFANGMIYQVASLDENRRKFNYISKNVNELYGCTVQQAKEDANLIYGKIHPDDINGLIEKEKTALRNMSVFETEARIIMHNGNIRWAYYVSQPRIINEIVCWDGIEVDITERKQMELELRKAKEKAEESELTFRKIFEDSFDAVLLIDKTGVFVECNQAALNLLKMTREQFLFQPPSRISPEYQPNGRKSVEAATEMINLAYKKELHRFDWIHINSEGDEIVVEVSLMPIKVKGKTMLHTTWRDISERKHMELKLFASKEKAEESDRLKSAFLANMSHEIRTPMNGILGFTNLLKEPDLTGEDQQKFIDIIEKSGNRMLSTVNDIVDISKIEAGQVDVIITEININKLMDELFEFFLPEAQKKKIELSFTNQIPTQQSSFKSDKEKLNSILTNFIKNALKYTQSGSIEFGYSVVKKARQNELEFFVKDTGIGIPEERQSAIFNRFEQADIEDRQAFEGSGLGLTIAKAYVEMLGGRIWVESEVGVGSQFYFTILCETENHKISKKNKQDTNKPYTAKKELKILIAEDDELAISFLRIVLKDYAKEMIIAKTGTEAVKMCRNNPDLDIVLMDIKFPGINGYEATQQIREFNKDVFIVAQTAYAQSGDREKCIQAGCNDYISKPIKKEKLVAIILSQF